MSEFAIRAEGLGKQYTIGAAEVPYRSLRDSLMGMVSAPFRRLGAVLRGESSSFAAHETIWALKDVSFEVRHGEVLGVIGHNGAGKSTLLKILSRITRPTEGRIDLYGRVGSLLEVGTGFHQELTGRENIYLNGAILGMRHTEITQKFDEIVAFSEVENYLDTPVKFYSSGMYLRLAFAVAAHLEPEILLVDEVLAVGDIAFQRKCLGKMGEVAQGGRTVLFVSHNMAAITQLCSRAIWLTHGRVMALGDPIELVSEYSRAMLSSSVVDLENVQRTGTGKARFKSIRTVDQHEQDCAVFGMGSDLVFEMVIVSDVVVTLQVSLMINDMYGHKILHAVNQDDHFEPHAEEGHFRIRVTFPDLRLYPGEYAVDVWCGYGQEAYDHIRYAASFGMEQRQVSGRVTKMLPGTAVFYAATKWCHF